MPRPWGRALAEAWGAADGTWEHLGIHLKTCAGGQRAPLPAFLRGPWRGCRRGEGLPSELSGRPQPLPQPGSELCVQGCGETERGPQKAHGAGFGQVEVELPVKHPEMGGSGQRNVRVGRGWKCTLGGRQHAGESCRREVLTGR